MSRLKNQPDPENSPCAVIGLGYVGLPVALLLAESRPVYAVDTDPERLAALQQGNSYLNNISDEQLKAARFASVGSDCSVLARCSVILLCLPTPLDEFGRPDISAVLNAVEQTARHAPDGALVCIESSLYPGCTREVIEPALNSGPKKFMVCCAPERLSPGQAELNDTSLADIPRVIGSDDPQAASRAEAFYSQSFNRLHRVSDSQTAEMVKMLENSYRLVNISFINEIGLLCGKLGIDVWETIDAASTKPFGFQPFYPGPGIGGHCIPLDPLYLDFTARRHNFALTMVESALRINGLMPHRMVVKITSALNSRQRSLAGGRLLFIGVTYKEDTADTRESPVISIMRECHAKGARLAFSDPYIDVLEDEELGRLTSLDFEGIDFDRFDCLVLAVRHSCLDISRAMADSDLIVDLRNGTAGFEQYSHKIFKL